MIHKNFIYSKTHDYFLVLPKKTGTTLASWVFTFFDFYTHTRIWDDENNLREFLNPSMSTNHSFYLPNDYQNPKVIMTTRNPYDLILSNFTFLWNKNLDPALEDFVNYLIQLEKFGDPNLIYDEIPKFDYLIKLENFYNDILKIPFVRDSELNSSGILKLMTKKKLNESNTKIDKTKFLVDSVKKQIYKLTKKQFEYFNYAE